jgi:putative hydrolase of HD superfamily
MQNIYSILIELDKLKSTYRRSYITGLSRNENSAEHSWHLAMALLALKDMMPAEVNIDHALRIALAHDVCEIGPGDVSIHSPDRSKKAIEEKAYMEEFAAEHQGFALEIKALWEEYEARQTLESRWVEVVDRLLPFLLNIATEGKVWREENLGKSRIIEINAPIAKTAPELYAWLLTEIEKAVQKGWLLDE